MEKIGLFQPRHAHAPEEGKGHIYLPSSLITVGSRILAAGGDIEIQDGNFEKINFNSGIMGANVVGPPYIPIVIALRKKMIEAIGKNSILLLGGQVINGLSATQFGQLFGRNVFNGNFDPGLERGLGIGKMPSPEETSCIPGYEKISDERMKEYLEHEFCLYLSQGCKYACDFCAADRSRKDPITGDVQKTTERYRNMRIIHEELEYLVTRAKRLGIHELTIYLSNLDLFQTPEKLKEFAHIVKNIKNSNPGFSFKLRGLSTVSAFMDTYEHDKDVITAMVDAGLYSISFGIDGIAPEVWKSVKKGHNTTDKCVRSIQLTREEFGITPEIFMVFGHKQDTEKTLMDGVAFALDMSEKYAAIPRPYIAKDMVPGNSGWTDPARKEQVETLIRHPEYFQSLEYSALPTSLTDTNPQLRSLIERAFVMTANIPGNTSHLIYPISPNDTEAMKDLYRRLNIGKFDR